MRIGYRLDTHGGPYDQPVPTASEAVPRMDAIIEEGILSPTVSASTRSRSRSATAARRRTSPTPFQLMAILARETERVGIGSFATVLLPREDACTRPPRDPGGLPLVNDGPRG